MDGPWAPPTSRGAHLSPACAKAPLEVTDALGRKRSTKFDANNNIDSTTDAMGSGTTPGNVTDYGFDTRNNIETAPVPTGGRTVNTRRPSPTATCPISPSQGGKGVTPSSLLREERVD